MKRNKNKIGILFQHKLTKFSLRFCIQISKGVNFNASFLQQESKRKIKHRFEGKDDSECKQLKLVTKLHILSFTTRRLFVDFFHKTYFFNQFHTINIIYCQWYQYTHQPVIHTVLKSKLYFNKIESLSCASYTLLVLVQFLDPRYAILATICKYHNINLFPFHL